MGTAPVFSSPTRRAHAAGQRWGQLATVRGERRTILATADPERSSAAMA
jgi:hypothetical protein